MYRKISNSVFSRFFSNHYYFNKHIQLRIAEVIKSYRIDQIFDIGANVGQYASTQFHLGFKGEIVSFDPIPKCHTELEKKAKKLGKKWKIAERMALGNSEGEVVLNISENLESSSLLQMTPELQQNAPQAKFISTETVPIKTFDAVFPAYYHGSQRYMIKVDVQGYEYEVLQGGRNAVSKATLVQLELPFAPSYVEEKDFAFICEMMNSMGFFLHSLYPAYLDPKSGKYIHVDTIFVNNLFNRN